MTKTRFLIVGALCAGFSLSALACLNSYSQLRLHRDASVYFIHADILPHFIGNTKPDQEEIAWAREASRKARKAPIFENQTELAVSLVHMGKPQAAIELLQALEQKWPGRYETAANLGTAYELAGNNEKALEWIREGIRRNAKSHQGTEWLHVAILEAKLGRRAPGDTGRSILQLDFGPGPLPRLPAQLPAGADGEPLGLRELGLALRYQLIERTHFVAAPDPMVAGLLLDWAHLELLAGDQATASVLYTSALKYGHASTPMLRAGQAEAVRKLSAQEQQARKRNCQLCPRAN